jgi:phosphoenolpyruvate synthase/pyruvate phosphate dikinase
MQDVEFTVEKGKLWMLQTRDGKRTAQAAVRIAVDMVEEGLITREQAVGRVTPTQIDFFLHPQFDREAVAQARATGKVIARGLNVSPGAAFGETAFDADIAEQWAKEEGRQVIMVRPETKPDDVHGMLAAQGILTSRGGRTSHAALVARQFGKPAVVGVSALNIDLRKRRMQVGDMPVIIRLIDPPLHEFLPNYMNLYHDLTDLKIRLKHADTLDKVDTFLQQINEKTQVLKRVERLQEGNPMMGLRGVRLGIHIPELTTMQVRAVFEAACLVAKEGIDVHPEIMIPLTSHVNELHAQRDILEVEAKKVMHEQRITVDYKFGTMIEVPRAALTAEELAEVADFFSFGTNDLTQTTFGMSRDDAETGYLVKYMQDGIFAANPFATIDRRGVGQLMAMAVQKARAVKPGLECGICGEHAGDPDSIAFCHEIGLNYVSCSSLRVPIARLAAAHAAKAAAMGSAFLLTASAYTAELTALTKAGQVKSCQPR